jgi:hypothetical protein
MNKWSIQTNLEIPSPPKLFLYYQMGRGCSNKVAPSSSRTKPVKQDDNNERERESGMVRK